MPKKKKSDAQKPKGDVVWKHVMKDVDPMSSDSVPPHELVSGSAPAPLAPAISAKPKKLRKFTELSALPPPPPPAPIKPMIHGDTQRLDKRTGQKFTGGRMDIDARLDLHGMTEAQAHGALHRFLDTGWERQLRCVLVVTGKGLQTEGGMGVLRAAVPRWLNEPNVAQRVLSFSHAQPKDGGTGALYVLLKRQR